MFAGQRVLSESVVKTGCGFPGGLSVTFDAVFAELRAMLVAVATDAIRLKSKKCSA